MSGLYDEDGIDGPWEKAMAKPIQNQCDGCMAGKPLVDGRYHRMGRDEPGAYADLMWCEKARYGVRTTYPKKDK